MSETLRHPIRRTKSKLEEHDQKHDHHHASEVDAVRHPLKRTKSKINEHDHKQTDDPEELSLLERKPFAYPRIPTIYKNKMARPRWVLHVQAQFWRVLMGLGMFFHRLAPPRPPKPNFIRTIQTTISGKPGTINLMFYVPTGYETQKKQWKDQPRDSDTEDESTGGVGKGKRSAVGRDRRRSSGQRRWGDYPVVLNFHGGGFTLGSPTDDGRWCHTVVDECNAVVISVDYRLAPECPFPTAVEDGVDAVIWTHQHAAELGIDPDKIALSGFSSGANMAFTVPLRLWDEMMGFPRGDELERPDTQQSSLRNPFDTPAASKTTLSEESSRVEMLDPAKKPPPLYRGTTKVGAKVSQSLLHQVSDISLKAIVPWYPSLDYTRTREQRRATCVRKDQELPSLFTDLFDESYLHPPSSISLDSPYLSPGVAPTALLKNGLPQEIIMHTCEWDMLLDEGQAFRERLTSPEIAKTVHYNMIEGVPHGWDKAPNPWKPTPGVREHYLRACKELRRIFGEENLQERRVSVGGLAGGETEGWSAAPRGSVQVVR